MSGIRTITTVLTKAPDEALIRNIDFSDAGLATGETLSSIDGSGAVSPSGLTIDSESVSGTDLQVTLSAGTAGVLYTVTHLVVTSTGQKINSLFKVAVEAA